MEPKPLTSQILDSVYNNMFVEAAWNSISYMLMMEAIKDLSLDGVFVEYETVAEHPEQYVMQLIRQPGQHWWNGAGLMQDQEAIVTTLKSCITELLNREHLGKPVVGTLRVGLRWLQEYTFTLDIFVVYAKRKEQAS